METSDTFLLDRWINQRDAEAMATIVKRHSRMVFYTCRRILGNAAEAEDATQECFLRLSSVRSSGSSLPALLHTIATRHSLNRLRGDARRRHRERQFMETQANAPEADWNDVQRYVDEAIAALNENLRTPIIRHFLQGDTHEAISRDLGMTRAGVTNRINRGIQQIRSSLRSRGVEVGAVAFAAMLAAGAAAAAEPLPVSLTTSLGRLALSGARQRVPITLFDSLQGKWTLTMKTAAILAALAMVVAGTIVLHLYTKAEVQVAPIGQASVEGKESPTQVAVADPTPQAAAPEPQPAPEPAKRTVDVHVVSDTGYARPDAYVTTNWPYRIYYGQQTDINGNLKLTLEHQGAVSCMAFSQNANRAALFIVEPGATTADVVLKCRLCQVSGRVTNEAGAPVPIAGIELLVSDDAGAQYLAAPLLSDVQGFWTTNLPAANGYTVQARVMLPDGEPPMEWLAPVAMAIDSHVIELADIKLPHDLATKAQRNLLVLEQSSCSIDELIRDEPRERYSGTVQDPHGSPIPGVVVEVSFSRQSGMGSSQMAATDVQGHWSILMPANLAEARMGARHQNFVSTRNDKTIALPTITDMREGNALLVLQPGIQVKGTVRDEAGKPVPDAVVYHDLHSFTPGGPQPTANWPMEDVTSTRTAADGSFSLACLPKGSIELHILKLGFTPTVVPADIMPAMAPLDIVLATGGTIRGRIVDETGAPVPGAYIHSSFDKASLYAAVDADGAFVLEHVPANVEVELKFGSKGGFYGSSIRGCVVGKSYDLVLYHFVTFTGQVVDDATGAPVTSFEVRNGWLFNGEENIRVIDMSGPSQISSPDGRFSKEFDGVHLSEPIDVDFAVQIRAEGYYPAWGPLYRLGNKMEPMVIRLEKGDALHGMVVAPDGKPVNGATVVWTTKGKCFVRNGQFQPRFSHGFETGETDAAGAFELPGSQEAGTLLTLHASGYAIYEPGEFVNCSSVTLIPWATVEGMLDDGRNPLSGEAVPLSVEVVNSPTSIYWHFQEATRTDGTFAINYLPAMALQVGKEVTGTRGRRLVSNAVDVTPQPGEKVSVEIRPGQCNVTGSISYSLSEDAQSMCEPENLFVYARPTSAETPQGVVGTVTGTGTFVLNGLQPGPHELIVELYDPHKTDCGLDDAIVATGSVEFSVPEQCEGKPIELPFVQVQMR